jgi:hypothetical protein
VGDVRLRHLERDPRCSLLIFEAVPPFRRLEIRARPSSFDATSDPSARRSPAATSAPMPAAASPQSKPGILLRLAGAERSRDLAAILPV